MPFLPHLIRSNPESDIPLDTSPFSDSVNLTLDQGRDAIRGWIVIVPVVIGLLLLIAVICCLVAHRRRRQISPPKTDYGPSHAHPEESPLPVYGANNGHRVVADGGEAGFPIPPHGLELQQQQLRFKSFQCDAPPAYESENK